MRLGVLFDKNDLGGYLTKCVAWGLLDKIRFRAGSMIKCVLGRYLAKRFSGGLFGKMHVGEGYLTKAIGWLSIKFSLGVAI